MTRDELKQQVMRFSDRYISRINLATDILIDQAPNPAYRAMAHNVKTISFLVALDIAVGPDPVTNLLDAMVLASLTRIVTEDYFAPEVFGEDNARQLLIATRGLEEDVWGISGSVLTPDQQETLRSLIKEWRQKHPNQHYIWGIRFGEFSGQRAAALQEVVRSGGLLGQVKQTRESIDEVRDLGERTLYYMQRAPLLARDQAVGGLYDVLSQPEITSLLADSERFTKSMERLTLAVDELPQKRLEAIDQLMDRLSEERAAFVDQLVENEEEATRVLTELHGTIVASSELIGRVDSLMDKLPDPNAFGAADSEPVDINDYGRMIVDAATTAGEFTELVKAVEELVATPAWEKRLPEAVAAVGDVEGGIRGTLLLVFVFTTGTIVAFFASLLAYKALLRRLTRR
jgi:hypothetical protein